MAPNTKVLPIRLPISRAADIDRIAADRQVSRNKVLNLAVAMLLESQPIAN